jgi:transketolase
MSAGHGSMLLYALLYLTGYEDIDLDQLKRFRQLGSRTAGHPEYGLAAGIETTTGPLGQGLANAVGMALAERILNSRFGDEVVDHTTYAIAGDGDLMEGISQEAISLAGHLGLSKLIVLFDDNRVSIDGPTDLTISDDHLARFRASGWDVQAVDGHDVEEIRAAIARARETDTPSMIACRTTIGFGAPTKEGTAATHGAPLGAPSAPRRWRQQERSLAGPTGPSSCPTIFWQPGGAWARRGHRPTPAGKRRWRPWRRASRPSWSAGLAAICLRTGRRRSTLTSAGS